MQKHPTRTAQIGWNKPEVKTGRGCEYSWPISG